MWYTFCKSGTPPCPHIVCDTKKICSVQKTVAQNRGERCSHVDSNDVYIMAMCWPQQKTVSSFSLTLSHELLFLENSIPPAINNHKHQRAKGKTWTKRQTKTGFIHTRQCDTRDARSQCQLWLACRNIKPGSIAYSYSQEKTTRLQLSPCLFVCHSLAVQADMVEEFGEGRQQQKSRHTLILQNWQVNI